DKSWLGDECPLCHICGHQYILWNGCPKSYSLPPNPYYDSSVICDVGRGDEAENEKQEAHNVNSLMECTDMLDKVNSKNTEQLFECTKEHKKLMKLLDELDTIQFEITILAKLEEIEAQQGVKIEAQQGVSYEEAEIVSQSWLQEQTQLLKFQKSICDGVTYMATQLIEGRVELTQEIDQVGSYILDLEADLNKKVEVSEA
ncbi:hypothetical protein H5410_051792, partial [Solanum commersonii]